MYTAPVLIAGEWRQAAESGRFHPINPSSREPLSQAYPISSWHDCDTALDAAVLAAEQLNACPASARAQFLEHFADLIEADAKSICALAAEETGLPIHPRLLEVELPRTTNQLRQAARAAADGSWTRATIDTSANIRSIHRAIGPVVIFGPNNFPLAFNGVSGGDFAAAIAAGNPVIAKAHSAHPGTSHLLARLAHQALQASGLPTSTIQVLYAISRTDGLKLVSDPRTGAVAFTGSRSAGLTLKQAADEVGTPIYVELSSINPVIMLAGALREKGAALAEEFANSCLMGSGQFCTSPGLLILPEGDDTAVFMQHSANLFDSKPIGTLLSEDTEANLRQTTQELIACGAKVLTKNLKCDPARFCRPNTLLAITGKEFLLQANRYQAEAFGNTALIVVSKSTEETCQIINSLEGNLTGSIYSAVDSSDDTDYNQVEPILRARVGRLLNDKMPTGVAVSPAMNHGGPFPASGHPGFTAVGIPTSLIRFSKLHCYDNVRNNRLPALLQDDNPTGAWRLINDNWSQSAL